MNVTNKLVACIAAGSFLFSNYVYASGDPDAHGTIAIITKKGLPSPFPGVLYSDVAYALMKAEKELQDQRCKNEMRHELGMLEARLNTDITLAKNDAVSTKKLMDERVIAKDSRIAELEQDLVKARPSEFTQILWLGAGMLTILLGAAAIKLVNN